VTQGAALASSAGGRSVPRHVAIIMDGNGRWAKKRFLPRIAGHKKGIDAVKATVRAAGDLGLEVLTLYAFSTENWRRPEDEVRDLMGLLKHFIQADLAELVENGVRLRVIGDYRALNTQTTLVIALNYGAQAEIVDAVRTLAQRAKSGDIDPSAISADAIEAELGTAGLPPPDLLIRTSGEQRLSNFLLWQLAYAEMMFVDTLWPDFGAAELKDCLDAFAARERRYGGL
jgi:undecaprenyl diphosphate synthase